MGRIEFSASALLFVIIIGAVFFDFPVAAQAQQQQQCCIFTLIREGKEINKKCDDPARVTCADKPRDCQLLENVNICEETRAELKPCLDYGKICRPVLESTLADCPDKPVVAQPNLPNVQCDKTPSCTVFNNRCYSVYDRNVCPEIYDSKNCDKFQACKWENGACVTQLQSAINSRYDLSEQGRGKFLEPCAVTGSCRNTNDILKLLLNIVDYAMKLIGVLAFVMFIAGGVTMITSFGNAERFKKGQQMLVYAIIGIIVSVSAVLIVKFVLDALGVVKGFKVF